MAPLSPPSASSPPSRCSVPDLLLLLLVSVSLIVSAIAQEQPKLDAKALPTSLAKRLPLRASALQERRRSLFSSPRSRMHKPRVLKPHAASSGGRHIQMQIQNGIGLAHSAERSERQLQEGEGNGITPSQDRDSMLAVMDVPQVAELAEHKPTISVLETQPKTESETGSENKGLRGDSPGSKASFALAAASAMRLAPVNTRTAFDPIGIFYWGGEVMHRGPIHLYITWVGNVKEEEKALVRTFIASLNPSKDPDNTVDDWWATNTLYFASYDQSIDVPPPGGFVSPKVSIAAEYPPVGSPPSFASVTRMSLWSVYRHMKKVVKASNWPLQSTAIYVAISAQGIVQRGVPKYPARESCQDYCGWHYNWYAGKKTLKYVWVGIPSCDSCGFFSSVRNYAPPSASRGIHDAINILAHELSEVATDPDMQSWFDEDTSEVADKCAWNYGDAFVADGDSGETVLYNLVGLQGTRFLIQQLWDPTNGFCTLRNAPQ